METDVTKIYLTFNERRYLKRINKNPIVLRNGADLPNKYQTLFDKRLISNPSFVAQWESDSTKADTYLKYSITELGFEYLLYRQEKFADTRLPFIISTVIAVLALAVSVIALFLSTAQ